MKKLLFFLLIPIWVFSQSWDYVKYNSTNGAINCATIDSEGNTYSRSHEYDNGPKTILRKYDTGGNLVWMKDISSLAPAWGDYDSGFGGIQVNHDKVFTIGKLGGNTNFYIISTSKSSIGPISAWDEITGINNGFADIKIVGNKLYALGHNSNTINFSNNTSLNSLGGFIVVYSIDPQKNIEQIIKFDGGLAMKSIDVGANGEIFVTGSVNLTNYPIKFYNGSTAYQYSVPTNGIPFLVKFDANGNFDPNFGFKTSPVSGTNYVHFDEYNQKVYWANKDRIHAYQTTGQGNLEWTKEFRKANIHSIKTNKCGDLYFTGHNFLIDSNPHFIAYHLDKSTGNTLWNFEAFNTPGYSYGFEVVLDDLGQPIFFGNYRDPIAPHENFSFIPNIVSPTHTGLFNVKLNDEDINQCCNIDFNMSETFFACNGNFEMICGPNPVGNEIYTYKWFSLPSGNLVSQNNCLMPTATGDYKLVVANQFGCKEEHLFYVSDLIVKPDLGEDFAICRDNENTISLPSNPFSNPNFVIKWSINGVLVQTGGLDLVITPTMVPGSEFDVSVEVLYPGCDTTTDTVHIYAKYCKPHAEFEIINSNHTTQENGQYGPVTLHHICMPDVYIDGSASENETAYHIRISEFNLVTWQFEQDLFDDWVGSGEAPNSINLTNLISPLQFDPSKIYAVRLSVGDIWDEAPLQFFKVIDCRIKPTPKFEILNVLGTSTQDSPYGPMTINHLCDPVFIDGSASENETGYHVEIAEFDIASWTIGTVLYSNWVSGTGQAPNSINLSNLIAPQNFDESKIYMVKFSVGTPWVSAELQFIQVKHCGPKPKPVFKFWDVLGTSEEDSYYGPMTINYLCNPVFIDGSESEDETGYHIQIAEFDLQNWTILNVLYDGWVNGSGQAPSLINLNALVNNASFEENKTYMVKFSVGTPWVSAEPQFFRIKRCEILPIAKFELLDVLNSYPVDSYYGPVEINILCPFKAAIDGSASENESAYHVRVSKFDLDSWTITQDLFDNWVANTQAPSYLDLNNLIYPNSFEFGETYMVNLSVGNPWHSAEPRFFRFQRCTKESKSESSDFTFQSQLEVSPNPTNGKIFLRGENSENILSIELFDLQGKSLKSFSKLGDFIDVSSLEAGVYILKIKFKDGTNQTEKIIKK